MEGERGQSCSLKGIVAERMQLEISTVDDCGCRTDIYLLTLGTCLEIIFQKGALNRRAPQHRPCGRHQKNDITTKHEKTMNLNAERQLGLFPLHHIYRDDSLLALGFWP
jgi:hypothetical protein